MFPPDSWAQIADWVTVQGNFENLFALVDFFLCHSLSSADAERGFSSMKQLKTSKRTRLENSLLTLQLSIYIDGTSISKFDPAPSIQRWLIKHSRKNISGIVKAKRPDFMDNDLNDGPKKKSRQDFQE